MGGWAGDSLNRPDLTARFHYPNVLETFPFAAIIHVDPKAFQFNDDDDFTRRAIADALALHSLFVRNPACKTPLSQSIAQIIAEALRAKGQKFFSWIFGEVLCSD